MYKYILCLLLLAGSVFSATEIEITGDVGQAADTPYVKVLYMGSTSGTSENTTVQFGSNPIFGTNYHTRYLWFRFPTLGDSTIGVGEVVSSAMIGLKLHATPVSEGTTGGFEPKMARCLRNTTASDVCYAYYTGTTGWADSGATGSGDLSSYFTGYDSLKVSPDGAWSADIEDEDVIGYDTVYFMINPSVIDSIIRGDIVNDYGFVIQYDLVGDPQYTFTFLNEEVHLLVYASEPEAPGSVVKPVRKVHLGKVKL